jgi:hypothetical protein
MRVLLLHPEDSPRHGPWAGRRWDLIVDLGKSSAFSEAKWSAEYGCAVLRSDCFRQGIEDVKQVRKIFSAGMGRLVCHEGIDWWDLTSLSLEPEAITGLALVRLAEEINPSAELWSTRPGWPGSGLAALLGRSVSSFENGKLTRAVGRAGHYAGLLRRFTAAQIKEIFLDKYDAGYQWRSRFASRPRSSGKPVVLLPTAYRNVSHMAVAYASLLPDQSFLMVATRQSAKSAAAADNLVVRDLAAYVKGDPPASEIASLTAKWFELEAELCSSPEMRILVEAGVMDVLPNWIRDGLCARNAWRNVIDDEPVQAVLCGDDSNLYTRVPVLLAAKRKIPTVDFHHGALDGRYLLKDLPCDVYLTKNEMERDYLIRVCGLPNERIVIGAPSPLRYGGRSSPRKESAAVFFSEPYESAERRGEEVYGEILPALCRVAREAGRRVIVKLHPFESYNERSRLLTEILDAANRKLVTMVDGPLTSELMSQAWFGITVESTTVIDCLQNGIACFLCGWLPPSPYEYIPQYARFGVGEVLHSAEQIGEIPCRLANFQSRLPSPMSLYKTVDPAQLQRWLTGGLQESSIAGLPRRSAS